MKLRVAHLVNQLYYAGKEAGIMKISSRMDTTRFDVEIVVLGQIVQEQQFNAHALNTIALNKPPGNHPGIFFKLAKLFRERQYHVVYTHAWNTLLEGYLPALLARVPVKIHGEHGTFERSRLKDWLQPLIWGRFDAVTVVADDLRRKMQGEFGYDRDNVQVVYNGIDAGKFRKCPEARREFREQHGLENAFVVGTVGRFHPVKDHLTLIRGFAGLRSRVPEARLVFVGTEDEAFAAYRTELRSLGIEDDVVLVPPTADVERIVNGYDAFVLSSVSEGCSNVILEAMACGVPVVATAVGGNPELVSDGDTGLLFPVGSDSTLSDKLIQLHEDDQLRKALGIQAQEHVHSRFTIDSTVKNYENLYWQLYEYKIRKIM